MNTKDIFEETDKINDEISEYQSYIEKTRMKYTAVMNACSHEIVFKYTDNYPRRIKTDGTYFCPACGKSIKCFHKDELRNTVFNDSRIIPLTNLSLFGSVDLYQKIREEVYANLDLYYDYVIPTDVLSSKMESVLIDNQNRCDRPEKVLSKKIR
jgi:hypothetical protein